MCRSANQERFGVVPSDPSPARRQLQSAMQEAIHQRMRRRGLTPEKLRKFIRERGLQPACFFLR